MPDIQITAVEQNGSIEFTVDVLMSDDGTTADLRGLFFNISDESKVADLDVDGTDVSDFDTQDVINLGQGANMHGAASPFDAGVEFGKPGIGKGHDDIQTTSFVLSNTDGDLTLDDIAHMEFGARITSVGAVGGARNGSGKLVTTAPAAPDAVDDAYEIFEDGQTGLSDPSSVAEGVLFDVLDNDTDADGDTLTITHAFGASHGTVQIVDGDDADLLPGDAILYTPNTDYSGPDEFTYCIDDHNGGTDFATVQVAIEAVADIPDVSVETFATDKVNEIRLVVTATQTDDDNSEFIQKIVSSALPEDVTLTPAGPANSVGQPQQYQQEYILTLPIDEDADFDLTFTATSQELSNGDQEVGSQTVDIVYDYNSTLTELQFNAEDQSIWGNGDEFVFENNTFLGLDTGSFDKDTSSGPFTAGIDGHIKLGFDSSLHFEGGSIDAQAEYDVTVETNYNRTVDELLIETDALLTDAFFNTEGPQGSYTLDFVWDILLNAYAGVDIDFGGIQLDPLGIIPGNQYIDFGGIDETLNVPAIDIGPGALNIIDLNSDDLGGTINFPEPVDFLSLDWAWPNITTSGTDPLNPVTSSGESNNFLQLNLDVDELLTKVLGLPVNPLNPSVSAGPFYAELDILNVFVNAGLNFLQEFEMEMSDLSGMLMFENGTSSLFDIGDSLQISDASLIDIGGDGDGNVEFDFMLVPDATLDNLTELGFNVGGGVDVLSASAGYEVNVPNPFYYLGIGDKNYGFSDSVGFGPLAGFELSFPVADIEVYSNEFGLNFEEEQFSAFA